MPLHSQNSVCTGLRLIQMYGNCSRKVEKESYVIGISSIRTQIRSLAEGLSISFLRFSTHTSVKKTEMNPNRPFGCAKSDER